MTGVFCLMRLGAPHLGHVALIRRMLDEHPDSPVLVLVGSAEVEGRDDVPLPWLARVKLLRAMLRHCGITPQDVLFAPLAELKTDGWDEVWCRYLLDAASAALYADPMHYYAGDDYTAATFEVLRAVKPGLEVVIVPRVEERSGQELRRALAGDATLATKYAVELMVYAQYSEAQ